MRELVECKANSKENQKNGFKQSSESSRCTHRGQPESHLPDVRTWPVELLGVTVVHVVIRCPAGPSTGALVHGPNPKLESSKERWGHQRARVPRHTGPAQTRVYSTEIETEEERGQWPQQL